MARWSVLLIAIAVAAWASWSVAEERALYSAADELMQDIDEVVYQTFDCAASLAWEIRLTVFCFEEQQWVVNNPDRSDAVTSPDEVPPGKVGLEVHGPMSYRVFGVIDHPDRVSFWIEDDFADSTRVYGCDPHPDLCPDGEWIPSSGEAVMRDAGDLSDD